ncbi:MAG: tetratricopeptide repeat protein [Xanthomonadales bacterium]|nr:tetratricopeptide repeat protein [Xanthomonadales bacterium]
MSLFEELKRRNVFRVGIAYLITAWLLLQVVDLVLENINAPDWVMQAFMLAVAVGFAVTMVVAWVFELTPEGLKKEKEVDRSKSITRNTGRKLDRAIIGILVLALGYFVWDKFSQGKTGNPASDAATASATADVAPADVEPKRPSIAVLPFANRSSRDEDAFFAEGIHDDLLTSLAKVGSLKVISRTSVIRYTGTTLSIPEIASELGVSTVLEGGIQRSGDQVRINVQLIDANTDEHLWAENYDRALTADNLFSIQSEISREIVSALKGTLTDQESERLDEQPTDSLEAYAEYVLGRQELAKRTNESLPRAQKHFEKAIELDPEYVLAYVGLADSISLQVNYGDIFVTDSYAPRQAAIDRALALNPNSGEAYTSLANLRDDQNQDEVAEEFFKKAIELSPNYVTAWHWYAVTLQEEDRYEEALEMITKARELDPIAPILAMAKGSILWGLDRREEAFAINRAQLEKTPEFPNLYGQRIGFHGSIGEMGEAMRWSEAYAGLDATSSFAHVSVCNMLVQLGDDTKAEQCYDRVEESYPEASFGSRIILHQLRGEHDKAVEVMEQIAEQFPFDGPQVGLGYNYMTNGEWDKARAIVEENFPEYLGTEPFVVDESNDGRTQMAGMALYATGDTERGRELLNAAREYYESQTYIGPGPVFIHAFLGEKDEAIAALRRAMDEGWRFNWFRVTRYPMFDPMLSEPEWVELITELEADIADQRRWYEENKDLPVL